MSNNAPPNKHQAEAWANFLDTAQDTRCPACEGSGRTAAHLPCPACHGRGEVEVEHVS